MINFSIILPVRNGGTYVKECVNSILSQSYPHFNLIVLDNASTDGTPEWISSLQDQRIVIHPSATSLGIEQNWARIVNVEKNEFMTCIGHDDILLPGYLDEMVNLINQYPDASLYQTHFNYIDAEGKPIRPSLPMDAVQYAAGFLQCQMTRSLDSTGTGYMMKSADFDRLGGMQPSYPKILFADYQLWMQLIMLSYKATSPKFCFSYRIHQSASGSAGGNDYAKAFEKYVYFLNSVKKDEKIGPVLDEYGYNFLMYWCESLSHRILKGPLKNRELSVKAFMGKCKVYAAMLLPGKSFQPEKKFRIRLAKQLDSTRAGRGVFHLFKKIAGKIKK